MAKRVALDDAEAGKSGFAQGVRDFLARTWDNIGKPEEGKADLAAQTATVLGSVWDAMAPAIGEAMADIRKKVVEEGFYGREVTPKEVSFDQPSASADPRMGFQELMAEQAALAPKTPPMNHEPNAGIEV